MNIHNHHQHANVIQASLQLKCWPPRSKARSARKLVACGPTTHPRAQQQGLQYRLTSPWTRLPSGRPTSELLGSATFQTPDSPPSVFFFCCSSPALRPPPLSADGIGQWFEDFHHYEVTLVRSIFWSSESSSAQLTSHVMKRWLPPLSKSILRRNSMPSRNVSSFLVLSSSHDLISPTTTGFKVLSEAERTAALYSLLQHSTQVQIRFFITVLHQMVRADPITALLSPSVEGSMQSQMEAKHASMNLKSPGLESNMPSSPSTRTFNTSATNRQSPAFDSSSSFLSPDSANYVGNPSDAAATLAQQRAKLKAASNAAHRISAPAPASSAGERGTWCQFPWSSRGAR